MQEDWNSKEIKFTNKDKSSIISVFFHDDLGYLFIGHMGVLIPTEDEKLLLIEKLSFHMPYQEIKFDNRIELDDYLMNKYDISWNQPTAKLFIMENDQLLEGIEKVQIIRKVSRNKINIEINIYIIVNVKYNLSVVAFKFNPMP